MPIYVAKIDGLDRVKIGYTSSQFIWKRIRHLQTGCPGRLRVVWCSLEGDRRTETSFHKRFENSHIFQEWFSYEPHIRDFVVEERRLYKMEMLRKLEQEEKEHASQSG